MGLSRIPQPNPTSMAVPTVGEAEALSVPVLPNIHLTYLVTEVTFAQLGQSKEG
jgi:hypothetical protein